MSKILVVGAHADDETFGCGGTIMKHIAQGDDVYYLFHWGDGTDSGWLGPYPSGTQQSASHTWDEEGDYRIKVKAKDENGADSVWPNMQTSKIYAGAGIDISTIKGGLWLIILTRKR